MHCISWKTIYDMEISRIAKNRPSIHAINFAEVLVLLYLRALMVMAFSCSQCEVSLTELQAEYNIK